MGHHYNVSDEDWNEIGELVGRYFWEIEHFIGGAISDAIYAEKKRKEDEGRAATDNCGDGREN